MGILSGNPKHEPMHYGEVFDVWSFSMGSSLALSCYETFYNHAGDNDLKALIKDLMDQAKKQIKECNEILTHNEIAPPPSFPEKPAVKLEDIPIGARFPDPEIAATITAEISAGMILCSQIAGKCVREDIGALFMKYHAAKAALGTRALRMNKEKGWLVPPPLQVHRAEPITV